MVKKVLFFVVLFLSFCVQANCDLLKRKFPNNLSDVDFCSKISDSVDGFNFVTIGHDEHSSYSNMILWRLNNEGLAKIFKSAGFTMPFGECCDDFTKINKNIFISGESRSSGSSSYEKYQIQKYKGFFRVIGYSGCQNESNESGSRNASSCIDWNLLTGNYNLIKRKNGKVVSTAKGHKFQKDMYLGDQDFFMLLDPPNAYLMGN